MKHVILYFFVGALSLGLSRLMYAEMFLSENTRVLGYFTTPTPTLTPSTTPTFTPTPTLTPTLTPIPLPTFTPTTTPIPVPTLTSQEINGLIDRFSGQYGVSAHEIRHIAVCESGFRPNAINGPYAGLFQFGTITWQNNRKLMGEDPNPDLRFDAEEATQTASYLYSIGKKGIWPNCQP